MKPGKGLWLQFLTLRDHEGVVWFDSADLLVGLVALALELSAQGDHHGSHLIGQLADAIGDMAERGRTMPPGDRR